MITVDDGVVQREVPVEGFQLLVEHLKDFPGETLRLPSEWTLGDVEMVLSYHRGAPVTELPVTIKIRLVNLAEYLGNETVSDLLQNDIANCFRDKTPREIRQMYNVTPEEEEEYKKKYQWLNSL
jgi:hypothetical protein